MKAVLVFCEGNHDIAFVTRSLGCIAGATWIGSPISSLPSPFGPRNDPMNANAPPIVKSIIAQRYKSRTLDDLKLTDAAHPHPPSFQALVKVQQSDTVFALLRNGGDDAATAAKNSLVDMASQLSLGVDVTEMAAAFLFDADTYGVASRENMFRSDHVEILPATAGPSHAQWVRGTVAGVRCPVGLYVFHDVATGQGTLEGILAPLVEAEWPVRWRDAGLYLTNHAAPTDPVSTKASERHKAQICVTGQFRFPGDPMTQVIGRDGLPGRHFQGAASRSLVDFLCNVPW